MLAPERYGRGTTIVYDAGREAVQVLTGSSELDTRYGRRRGLSPMQRHAMTVVALLLGTLAAYLVFRNSETSIQSASGGFQVTSPTRVLVSYEVHKPKAWTVTCVIRARDDAGVEVGRATVTIPPGTSVARGNYPLTTSETANTGEVQDCARASGTG
jgi:hypothetical protein